MNIMKNKKIFWTIFSIVAVILVCIALLPKPIDMNLEQIGNGQKAVVFVYDSNLLDSNRQATEMNKARKYIGDQAIFLIARTGDPDGEDFKSRYQARSLELLFFNKKGELIDRQIAVLSAEELTGKLSGK